MEFSTFVGNAPLKAQLSRQEAGRGLSHAYILSGPAGSGRHTLARLLCGAMLCTAPAEGRPCGRCGPCRKVFGGIHPDVVAAAGPGAGKPIPVEQIRQLAEEAGCAARHLMAACYLITGECYRPAVECGRICLGRWCTALRERYHAEACNAMNYLRAAEGTTDPCLGRLLTQLGEESYRQADTLLCLLQRSL